MEHFWASTGYVFAENAGFENISEFWNLDPFLTTLHLTRRDWKEPRTEKMSMSHTRVVNMRQNKLRPISTTTSLAPYLNVLVTPQHEQETPFKFVYCPLSDMSIIVATLTRIVLYNLKCSIDHIQLDFPKGSDYLCLSHHSLSLLWSSVRMTYWQEMFWKIPAFVRTSAQSFTEKVFCVLRTYFNNGRSCLWQLFSGFNLDMKAYFTNCRVFL